MRVCICATQVPFTRGGAEIHVESLHRELTERGFSSEIVALPFNATSRPQLLKSSLAWRLLELKTGAGEAVDLVIATRFPSYLIDHPNKVVWLIHQFREAYDLLGTRYGGFTDTAEDQKVLAMIHEMDNRTLGEARSLFTNARNTAERLKKFNDIDARPLYHPPQHDGRYRCDAYGDYVLGVGRLERLKRFDLLIRAMRETSSDVRCKIAGAGPVREELQALIEKLGLADRVELLGWVDDERLLDLYAGCRAVYYAPYDEDYGYVTLESFKSGKPVLAAEDSGGVLEFVVDGENGYICNHDRPAEFAARIDALQENPELARSLGNVGRHKVDYINWDHVIRALTGTARIDGAG
jgi:glycosyltransferase involved in cell wall biosynthesis